MESSVIRRHITSNRHLRSINNKMSQRDWHSRWAKSVRNEEERNEWARRFHRRGVSSFRRPGFIIHPRLRLPNPLLPQGTSSKIVSRCTVAKTRRSHGDRLFSQFVRRGSSIETVVKISTRVRCTKNSKSWNVSASRLNVTVLSNSPPPLSLSLSFSRLLLWTVFSN